MKYDFRLIPEALRAGAFAAIVFAATLLVDLDVDAITSDWQAYVKASVSGAGAFAGTAILARLTRK
jgi:hypothetical protein